MNKLKVKHIPSKGTKKKKITLKNPENEISTDSLMDESFWEGEIAWLTSQPFTSLDEAIKMIADSVMTKLGISGSDPLRVETQDFIIEIITSNEGLSEEIRNILSSKRPF